ncbi:MAG TPA: polysaccharide biosynthesis C-terminal domain-containing protein, partial [Bacilli bacterium]|nr:polysaccharide biosynthesis C-terminal domain-containing protein [Bacilli bacterium]
VYKTDLGVQYVKQFAILFLASYVISPLVSIMNTLGYSKETFTWSTCFNILKLILIFSLVFIPQINYYSLIIATSITLILYTLVIYFRIKNIVYFKFTFSEKVNVLLLAVLSFFIVLFLRNVVKLHYLLVSIIALLIFVGSFILLKIFHLDHK